MISPLFTLIFLFSIVIISGREYPCTYQSGGNFYDFSPLSKCDRSGYTVSSSGDGTFVLNICNEVNGCGGTGVCQDGSYNGGRASSASFGVSGNNVQLTYSNGDTCPNGSTRKSIITLMCSQNANPDPKITFISESPQCTYNFQLESKEACSKPQGPQKQECHVKVFLVPHTHDDVGWLETVEGYYNSAVKHILDTSVAQLIANPSRKFIYVEQAFFTLWWDDTRTTDEQRNNLRTLVKNGQWEFVLGSWVMPDEACTTYGGLIDQMTLGHQFLLNTFGVLPSKGWQIDPFGASTVTPLLEKLAGFDAHLIDRISHKDTYQSSQTLEFTWRASPSLGSAGEIFTEIMGGGGEIGNGYCDWYFSFNFENDPVNSGNVAKYGQQFIDMVNSRISWYTTPNLLADWGCDFSFQNANPMFHSMDQVVDWLQQNEDTTGVYVKYATLSEYYQSVFNDKPRLPAVYEGDFFPYLGGLWWTGYYTSRVELKGWVRVGEASQKVAETIYALARSLPVDPNKAFNSLYQLRVANGYAQHHDGVTGTSEPDVVEMYKNYIIDGMNAALGTSASYISHLIQKQGDLPNIVSGTSAVESISNNQVVAVIVYNSLGWTRNEVVKLAVNRDDLSVLDSSLNKIPYQISPAVGGNITSTYQLFFIAKVSPLGYQTYFVSAPSTLSSGKNHPHIKTQKHSVPSPDAVVENSILSVTISGTTGRISSISNKKSGVTLNVDQNLMKYISKQSGAYAFAPEGPSTALASTVSTKTVSGPVVTEVTQTYPNAKQTIRLYTDGGNEDVEGFVELVYDIGPLPSKTEIITLFSTNINTGGAFTTDDNGYELLDRKYQSSDSIPGNYYPIIYASYINDENSQLTLISERSHGVSSQKDGELEVMLHRNPDMGDGFGPGLTDTTEVYPALRVIVDSPLGSSIPLHRQPYLMNFPLSTFSAMASSASNWVNTYTTQGSFLKNDLPSNVHLLSVSALNATSTSIIVRLTHLFAVGENPTQSQPVNVDLGSLFQSTISKITETTITANKVLGPSDNVVTINPKEIRTFLVDF